MKSNQLFWFSYFKFLFIFLCNLQGMHIHYFAYCKLEKVVYMVHIHSCSHKHASIIIYSFFSWKCLYMVKAISSVAVLQNMIWYICKVQQFCYRFLKWYFSSGKFDLKRKQLIIFSYNIGMLTKCGFLEYEYISKLENTILCTHSYLSYYNLSF